LNRILSDETERLNTINAKRNRFHALYKKYVEQGNFKKAGVIKENNLGKVKYNSHKEKNDQRVKSYINFSLNQLILYF
jgi:ribosomal protein S17